MSDKTIIIVGAGGFAREVLGYIFTEKTAGVYDRIKGIVVDGYQKNDYLPYDLPYLGSVAEYKSTAEDLFLVCIGENPGRRQVIELLKSKGAKLFTYVSESSYVNSTAKIGEGVIVAPFCIINANVILGKYALLNSYSAIGHDSIVGVHAVLSPYAAINGGCRVGDNLIMGTRATIFPKINLGNNCIITTHSYVKNDKGDNRFIHIKAKEIDLENRL